MEVVAQSLENQVEFLFREAVVLDWKPRPYGLVKVVSINESEPAGVNVTACQNDGQGPGRQRVGSVMEVKSICRSSSRDTGLDSTRRSPRGYDAATRSETPPHNGKQTGSLPLSIALDPERMAD